MKKISTDHWLIEYIHQFNYPVVLMLGYIFIIFTLAAGSGVIHGRVGIDSSVQQSPTDYREWNLLPLNPTVTLSSCDGKFGPYPGSVPGEVHTDLMEAGVIKQDPYFRYEEENLSWITDTCWSYSVAFSSKLLTLQKSRGQELKVRFDKIDTVASLYWNGANIGTSQNAFRSFVFSLPLEFQDSTKESYVLRIDLESARQFAKKQAAAYPYTVPATQNYNVWAEPSSRNFVRKAGSDMGWDWGPAFISTGIFGEVVFFTSTAHVGRLEGFTVQQRIASDYAAADMTLRLHIHDLLPINTRDSKDRDTNSIDSIYYEDGNSVDVVVKVNGVVELSTSVKILPPLEGGAGVNQQVVTLPSIHIEKLQLWWPRGSTTTAIAADTITSKSKSGIYPNRDGEKGDGEGEGDGDASSDDTPYMYTVEVLYGSSQQQKKLIGFRTVELIQDPIPVDDDIDSTNKKSSSANKRRQTQPKGPNTLYNVQPATFYFRVNGIAMYMRGANFIPIDSFPSRVTAQDRRYILESAAASNMNMVRVWGGGMYQPDDFYETADKLGLLVWQEVMLACALYPRNAAFLQEVSAEVRHQALRLGVHASIVVWGGNNENEVALGWFSESIENRDLYVADYSKLYADTIYPALVDVLGVDSVGTGTSTSATGTTGTTGSGAGIATILPVSVGSLHYTDAHSTTTTTTTTTTTKHRANTAADDDGHHHSRRYPYRQQQVVWVDSSPSNGLLSADPYAKKWGAASTETAGDVHYYNYGCDCEDSDSYPAARFISEFGFQTMPSYLAYRPVTLPEDWFPNSPLLRYRQRHEDGNEQMEEQILRHFHLPATCASTTGTTGSSSASRPKEEILTSSPSAASMQQQREFDMYLYLTNIQQGRCYETAFNKWRQIRGLSSEGQIANSAFVDSKDRNTKESSTNGGEYNRSQYNTNGYTMGILYWQLNDIWQGPSWASMDWNGRWKALQYSVKRAFAPITVTTNIQIDNTATSSNSDNDNNSVSMVVDVYAVSDLPFDSKPVLLNVAIELVPWQPAAVPAASRTTQKYPAGTILRGFTGTGSGSASSRPSSSGSSVTGSSSSINSDYLRVVVPPSSSVLVAEIALDDAVWKFSKCTPYTCYLRITTNSITDDGMRGSSATTSSSSTSPSSSSSSSSAAAAAAAAAAAGAVAGGRKEGTDMIASPYISFLAPMKDILLSRAAAVTIGRVAQVTPYIVSFQLSVNATSPFLLMELTDEASTAAGAGGGGGAGVYKENAGWFSDNNFIAEQDKEYSLSYTSYRDPISVVLFQQRLQARVLQHAYDCTLPMRPRFT